MSKTSWHACSWLGIDRIVSDVSGVLGKGIGVIHIEFEPDIRQ
ncbi:MAG: hypothetical protein ACJ0BN_03755 [Limisphaerales bacterium]